MCAGQASHPPGLAPGDGGLDPCSSWVYKRIAGIRAPARHDRRAQGAVTMLSRRGLVEMEVRIACACRPGEETRGQGVLHTCIAKSASVT